ncbi:hypothetical protein [Xanthomonas campestris]
MPLAIVPVGQDGAALELEPALVYQPPMAPADRVEGIEARLLGIAGP